MGKVNYNELVFIEPDKIVVEDNTRKNFNAEEITELANSISSIGLINPVTICENKDDDSTYRLIAGERRFRACQQLEMTIVPCIIVEGHEDDLKELQLIENCQRRDIGPIEELEVFAQLISKDYTPQNIADNIGKSIKYINIRLNLIKLTDRAKMLLFNEEINLSQCKYLVVMDEELQEQALNDLVYTDHLENIRYKNAESFRKLYMKNSTASLKDANFDINDKDLFPEMGVCGKCKFNSTINTVLFEEMSIDGFCSKKECYEQKLAITIENRIQQWVEKNLFIAEVSEHYHEDYHTVTEYIKCTPELLKEHDLEIEMMLIIVQGYNRVGEHYPIFTKKQLKKINKTENKKVDKTPGKNIEKKSFDAVLRYTKLVTSKIAQNLMQSNILFSGGVITMAIYKLYIELDKTQQELFINIITGKQLSRIEMGKQGNDGFFNNLKTIENNIEYSLAVLAVIDLDEKYVYKDSQQFTLIQKLAFEAGVDIEECKKEITEESGTDLTDV